MQIVSLCLFVSVGMLGEDSWPPAVEFYDFLKIIDMQEPNSAQQKTPQDEEEEEVDEEDVNVEDETLVEEATDSSPSSSPYTNHNPHSEL